MNPEEYLKDRVDDQINWYDRKSSLNKRWAIRMEVITIVGSSSIPMISNLLPITSPWVVKIVSAIGVLLAVIAGLTALMKYRENWVEYRTTSEMLRHEKFMFLTKAGVYAEPGAFGTFVESVESLLTKEVSNWKGNRTASENEEGSTLNKEEAASPATPNLNESSATEKWM